ncbi:huntingtin isoform X2 [Prorops nasuta]|uniref:huntingtin isoform X2 n=1 Tax=Prorops nasuta TaxID=863751 RepID=UPI0034CD19E7
MTTNILKAIEALQLSEMSNVLSESSLSKKDKIAYCVTIVEGISLPSIKQNEKFLELLSASMRTLLLLCDDSDSDIRMVADESLNKLIRAVLDTNVVKVHIELYNEIKRNGSSKALRAALWKFAQLSHMIRPGKKRPYISNLVPCIVAITERSEDSVIETLAQSLPLILRSLGLVMTDSENKNLLMAFFRNVSSTQVVFRRAGASMIVTTCSSSKRPQVFLYYAIDHILGIFSSINDEKDQLPLILGIFGCLKMILPHLERNNDDESSLESLLQVYKICLQFAQCHSDHNIINAALETLVQLFQNPVKSLVTVLLCKKDAGNQETPNNKDKRKLDSLKTLDSATSSVEVTPPNLAEKATTSVSAFQDTNCTDKESPIVCCCRYLVSSFLLRGNPSTLIPDNLFRVSVKSLALTCISYTIRLYPEMLLKSIANSPATDETVPTIKDVLLFTGHSDPQIRGNVYIMIGYFLKSSLLLADKSIYIRVDTECSDNHEGNVSLVDEMLRLLLKGLKDDSAIACRQALLSLNICLAQLLESGSFKYSIPILNILPQLVQSPYFLIKMSLVDLLSKLSYATIEYITGKSMFQTNSINVMLTLLGDQDQRVRHATSDAIVKMIPSLNFSGAQDDVVARKASSYIEKNFALVPSSSAEIYGYQNRPTCLVNASIKPFTILNGHIDSKENIEDSLSSIINSLTDMLILNPSKHLMYGCCEALSRLSEVYTTIEYPKAWSCIVYKSAKRMKKRNNTRVELTNVHLTNEFILSPSGKGLMSLAICLLSSSPLSLDLLTHRYLTNLAGNLASGLAFYTWKYNDSSDKYDLTKYWGFFNDKQQYQQFDLLLIHIMKILNIYVHVILEEQTVQRVGLKAVLSSHQSLLPRKKPSFEQKQKDKSPIFKIGKEQIGVFHTGSYYLKMYEIIKAAHMNYLATLESNASEMYMSLLNASLDALSQLFEIAGISEAVKIAEEALYYLEILITLSPTATVKCVQQLLKCLFGTNLNAQWNELDMHKCLKLSSVSRDNSKRFYDCCLQKLSQRMTDTIKAVGNNCQDSIDLDTGWMKLSRRIGDKKLSLIFKNLTYSTDHKNPVAVFISLFEPMVIKSLRQYTITSSIELQCQVLMLLNQLIQLRINYCLLDSEKVFINFVLKQFELIEEGYIEQIEELLPKVFQFLVQLSFEKNLSETIISIPEVIQLCDRLVASEQPPLTYCVPALVPVVKNIFLLCDTSLKPTELKELETTREVLMTMLLRLANYHEILDLLSLCLNECRFSVDGNGEEKWRKWSRLTADAVLPMLAEGKISLEFKEAHIALIKLFSSISPTVFRPVDPLLKVLFASILSEEAGAVQLSRWLGMINVIQLFLISCAKEEAMLARLSDLAAYMPNLSNLLDIPSSVRQLKDPLNASGNEPLKVPPDKILAKFIFKVIRVISGKIHRLMGLTNRDKSTLSLSWPEHSSNLNDYLIDQFSLFLQLCIHMLESGSHCKVANAAMQLIRGQNVSNSEDAVAINDLNRLILNIGNLHPILTCQWIYLLTILSYNEMSFWWKVLNSREAKEDSLSIERVAGSEPLLNINDEIVRKSGTILFCDYVCENLNSSEPLTWLLANHIEKIIYLSVESPVKDLLAAAVHRNPIASGLFIQAVATKCTNLSEPSFVKRLLRCIECTHHSQCGAVILFLVPRLLSVKYLVLSRMAVKIARRKVEILLTLSTRDATEQLPRDDLVRLMDQLQMNRLFKKHATLVNLLNKLGAQLYDFRPLELEQSRPFAPLTVRNIEINREWFLDQIKQRCCCPGSTYSFGESAQLLSVLDFDDCLSILSCQRFNVNILQECIKLGIRVTSEQCQRAKFERSNEEKDLQFDPSPLYAAAKKSLSLRLTKITTLVPVPHEIFNPASCEDANVNPANYASRFANLVQDSPYWDSVFAIIPPVVTYIKTLAKLKPYNLVKVDIAFEEDLAKFALLCLEMTHWMIHAEGSKQRRVVVPHLIDLALNCANEILKEPGPSKYFGSRKNYSWVCSAALALTNLFEYMSITVDPLPEYNRKALAPALQNEHTKDFAVACIQMASLIAWLERDKTVVLSSTTNPFSWFVTIEELIVNVSRQPLVNSYVLIPPLVWKHGWHVNGSGETKCHFPLLSSESNHLQEVDILEQFIFRVNLLGWTCRLQFEEMWMALLGVLSITPNENISLEDVTVLIQANCLSVRAITRLLLQTLYLPIPGNPAASSPMHLSRDPQLSLQKASSQKLYMIQDLLIWKYQCMNNFQNVQGLKLDHIFNRGNIEKTIRPDRFTYSQLPVSFLWSMCNLYEDKLSTSVLQLKNVRNDALVSASLDLASCLHFLIELYSSWTLPQANIPMQLLVEVVKSMLGISELFIERSQYQWMLEVCLEIFKTCPLESNVIHQYLAISVCKAAAVLTPLDVETLDKVKHLIDINLKSGSLAFQVSALHGLLYLFESAALANCEDTMNLMYPVATEYIQKRMDIQDLNNRTRGRQPLGSGYYNSIRTCSLSSHVAKYFNDATSNASSGIRSFISGYTSRVLRDSWPRKMSWKVSRIKLSRLRWIV